ncbi:MAG: cystathionine beta-lyase [Rhodospirillaceae bacterium]|nr:cystathionine beta-lyase [Rhodospirillaceae bacterium]
MSEPGAKDRTIAAHAGNHPHEHQGVVNPPVYRASTVLFPTVQELRERYGRKYEAITYGRDGTQTHRALAEAFTTLEGSERALVLPSGVAAVATALLGSLNPGDHLLMVDTAYEPTREICEGFLRRIGVETTYYDPMLGAGVATLIRPNTKAIYMESPGSLTFEIQDIPAIVAAAKQAGCRTILDNTWATPLFFKPPRFGIDLAVYSASKYIGGHSDLMMGILTFPAALHKTLGKLAHGYLGHASSADDAYAALRGLRTLHARLTQHQATGLALARWLAVQPEVEQVLHPALPGTPGHEFWQRDFSGASGLFGFVLKPVAMERVDAMLNGMKLFGMGYSWGGYESLMIRADLKSSRTAKPWHAVGRTLRISAGLEDPDDLIADLAAGLARLHGN